MEKDKVRLTELVRSSGCNAKLPPGDLHSVLSSLPVYPDRSILGGYESADDAFIFDLGDRAMLQTVDFFPPMVDDPYLFGQIAAANALSDIYAMGGEPRVALSLACFPSCLSLDVLELILRGGMDKAKEAGCTIAGGHTISDREPKYGLAVTGFADKDRVWQNKGAEEGDLLVLTKKLGSGITMTASKGGEASEDEFLEAAESMRTLNKAAKEEAEHLSVHAATDVTGFSLIGHSHEMAAASGVTIELDSSSVPLLKGAGHALYGFLPEGRYTNEDYLGDKFISYADPSILDILLSPETSGGLLLSLPEKDAHRMTGWIIGRVIGKEEKPVIIR